MRRVTINRMRRLRTFLWKKKPIPKLSSLPRKRMLRWISASFFYLLLVWLMTPGIEKKERIWEAGDIPEEDFKAPHDFLVFNDGETEARRRQAEEKIKPAYILDNLPAEELNKKISSFFEKIEKEGEDRLLLSPLSLRVLGDEERAKVVEDKVRETVGFLLARGILSEGERLPSVGKVTIRQISPEKEWEEDPRRIITQASLKKIIEQRTREVIPQDRLLRMTVREISEKVIEPNLKLDKPGTNRRREEARRAVAPQYDRVKKGELILQEGVKVTEEETRKLKALLSSSSPGRKLARLGGISLLTLIFFFIIGIYLRKYQSVILTDIRILLLLGLTVVGVILIARLIIGYGLSGYFVPLAIAPMLIAILVEPRLAVVVAVVLSIFIGVLTEYRLDYMVVTLVGGMVGLFRVAQARRRSDLIRAGLLVGLVNVIAIFGFYLLEVFPRELVVKDYLWGMGNGLISAVVVLGMLPIFEPLFKITTDIKLLELLDINQPILERLKNEAPGTYQSSLVVANLAESAAQAVGANALLAKVGSYYHDIGKIKKACYFSENQMLAKNKHEKLSPSMSSLILISHVKEGVEVARRNRLPEVIVDIVHQHHGTTLASFFYQRAVEEDEHQTVSKEPFLYPGPKPQTREAAIVMLADSVEAASRTLSDPTPGRIKNLVRRVIDNKFADYQLDESNLALRDLHQISETFTLVLTSMFHTRVEYPQAQPGDRRRENGREDRNKKSPKKNKSGLKNSQTGGRGNAKEGKYISGRSKHPLGHGQLHKGSQPAIPGG